eukprot:COSAG05_NODE_6964_length_874_cov_0.989677_1_plen_37_part_10
MFMSELEAGRTPRQLLQLFIVCLIADSPFDARQIRHW